MRKPIHAEKRGGYFSRGILFLIAIFLFTTCKKEPSATFEVSYDVGSPQGHLPIVVSFSTMSTVVGGKEPVYVWNFGDGTADTTGMSPVHEYKEAGRYVVTVKGFFGSYTKQIDTSIYFATYTPVDTTDTTDTTVVNTPCSVKFMTNCAKKLTAGVSIKDTITSTKKGYYYFDLPKLGVFKIELNDVPSPASNQYKMIVWAGPNNSTEVIREARASGGSPVVLYGNPKDVQRYYVTVEDYTIPGGAPSHPFTVTYSLLNTDQNEWNNDFAHATVLPLSSVKEGTILPVDDNYNYSNKDVDVFKFHLDKAGVVDIKVDAVPHNSAQGGYVTLELYPLPSGSPEWPTDQLTPGDIAEKVKGPYEAGDYYIKLYSSYFSLDQYSLSVTRDTNDNNEWNNSFAKATLIQQGEILKGTIRPKNDVDYFKYTAVSNSAVTITIPEVPGGLGTMNVYLYQGAQSSDYLTEADGSAGETISFTTPPLMLGHVYYIKVSGWYDSKVPYTITVTP